MGRVKKAPTLDNARLLLLRRRIARRIPRGSGRALAGLCLLLLFAGAVAGAANAVDRAGRLGRMVGATTAALGFSVQKVEVEGRAMTGSQEILAALDAGRGTPIMSVDPVRVKTQLEALPWIRRATVERRLPDTIHIQLDERKPLALWQHHGQIVLVDHDGTRVTADHLDRYTDLLMVVGDDAPAHAEELIGVLATQPSLAKKIAAAIWVSDRRWNLHLDSGIDVEMPEQGLAEAWSHLAKIDAEHGLLARDIQQVDLRFPDRVVIRLAAEPVKPLAASAKRGAKSAKPLSAKNVAKNTAIKTAAGKNDAVKTQTAKST